MPENSDIDDENRRARSEPAPGTASLGDRGAAEDVASKLDARGFYFVVAGVAVLAAFLTWFTWARWGDAVIDVGRELEVAWKISEGRLLYRDVAYNYGPLSPHLNAALLRIFGVEVLSFVLGGLLSAGLGAWLVYLVARRFLGRSASAAIVPVFLLECVFQHYYWNGSFNFILPYSFPAVHGTLLALGAVLSAFRYIDGRRRGHLALAGSLAGLSLLCKLEVAAAVVLALAATTTLIARRSWREPAAAALDTSAWALPAALVPALGYLPFVAASSAQEVFAANVFRADLVDVSSNVFFLRQLGMEDPADSLAKLLVSCLLWTAAIALCWFASRIKTPGARAAMALALVGATWALPVAYDTPYRCLPFVALVVLVTDARRSAADRDAAAGCTLATFALLALGRIFLNAGTHHYGFFLAVPSLVLFAVFAASYVPRWLRLSRAALPTFVALILALLVCQSARSFAVRSAPKFRSKTLELSGVNGRMMAHPFRPRYLALKQALDHLAENSDPEDSLLVIPEGAAVNFLTGLKNPTSYNLFTPPELNAPGVEQRLTEQIQEHQVDMILVIDRRVVEYGFRAPGVDYALELWKVLRRAYSIDQRFGRVPPFARRNVEGGAFLFRRRE